MSDTETLSAEDKAYFDTRGENVAPSDADVDATLIPPSDDDADTDAADLADEPIADGVVDPDKPTGQSKVPLAALTKERNERKAVAAKLAETERKAAILEDRWNQALAREQQVEKPTAVESKPPLDANGDPMAVINELLAESQQRKQSEAERAKTERENAAANEAWGKTLNVAQAQYTAAAAADETFEPTYNALRNAIGQEYMDLYGMTEAQAVRELDNFEAQQIAWAVDRGIDVGAHMRKLAKARNIAVTPKAPEKDAGEDIDRIASGVNGATSLSNAGGGRVATTNAQSIADMSPDEFGAWLGRDGNKAKFRRLAGG